MANKLDREKVLAWLVEKKLGPLLDRFLEGGFDFEDCNLRFAFRLADDDNPNDAEHCEDSRGHIDLDTDEFLQGFNVVIMRGDEEVGRTVVIKSALRSEIFEKAGIVLAEGETVQCDGDDCAEKTRVYRDDAEDKDGDVILRILPPEEPEVRAEEPAEAEA